MLGFKRLTLSTPIGRLITGIGNVFGEESVMCIFVDHSFKGHSALDFLVDPKYSLKHWRSRSCVSKTPYLVVTASK